jgi:hypothetical protein
VFAAVVEGRTRTGREIDDRSGHEHLAGLRAITDAKGKVDGDARQLGAASFDFTGVDPDPNVEADLAAASRIAVPQRMARAGPRRWR